MIRRGKPAIVLAPMDGVTDSIMRRLLTRLMPFDYCVTEFIRISGVVPPEHVFLRDAPELNWGSVTESGVPVGVQLLGGDPERMALSAQRVARLGAPVIDLNFGCPAPTVNRHDGGATLLQYPDRIEEIVRAVRQAVPAHIPVSAKLRLGWEDPRAIFLNAERAERGGASWITIHGRTKVQGYTPPAYWEPIGEIRKLLSIPVIANGEIWSVDDLLRCIDQTGCEHFMLGRGALSRLDVVAGCSRALGATRGERMLHSMSEPLSWSFVLGELVTLSREAGESERRTLARMKQWINYAHRRGDAPWFSSVKRLTQVDEFLSLVAAQSVGLDALCTLAA